MTFLAGASTRPASGSIAGSLSTVPRSPSSPRKSPPVWDAAVNPGELMERAGLRVALAATRVTELCPKGLRGGRVLPAAMGDAATLILSARVGRC